jgi:hypothetical protein
MLDPTWECGLDALGRHTSPSMLQSEALDTRVVEHRCGQHILVNVGGTSDL